MTAMKSRIHINLSVRDLEASKAFYAELFGAAPSKEREGYANWRLDAPALHLALVHDPAARPAGESERHFGVELFDQGELATWQARPKKKRVSLRLEEQVTCCYAVGNKFWAKDPDGNEWEFWVRTGEAESMTGEQNAECCTPAQKEEATIVSALPGAKVVAGACCAPAAKALAEGPGANRDTVGAASGSSCC